VVLAHQAIGMLQLQTKVLKDTYLRTLLAAQSTLAMKLVSAARREGEAALARLQVLSRWGAVTDEEC